MPTEPSEAAKRIAYRITDPPCECPGETRPVGDCPECTARVIESAVDWATHLERARTDKERAKAEAVVEAARDIVAHRKLIHVRPPDDGVDSLVRAIGTLRDALHRHDEGGS